MSWKRKFWLTWSATYIVISYICCLINPLLGIFSIAIMPIIAIFDYIGVLAFRTGRPWNNISDHDLFMQNQMKQQTNHLRNIDAKADKKV